MNNSDPINSPMLSHIFCKPLKDQDPDFDYMSEVLSKKVIWWTAVDNPDGSLTFVKNKPDAKFFMTRITSFPKILEKMKSMYPEMVIETSYVTKCMPNYSMVPHVDANRSTAIITPIGPNKGNLSFYLANKKVYTHVYTGPVLARISAMHSAENYSPDIRYSITIGMPGTYWQNYLKYK